MKKLIFLSSLIIGLSAGAADKVARQPASECIRTATIECANGYIEREDSGGCFRCVHHSADPKSDVTESCIKTPTITCVPGFVQSKDMNGCITCAPPLVAEPSCIKAPVLTCIPGYRNAADTKGCYHCVAN